MKRTETPTSKDHRMTETVTPTPKDHKMKETVTPALEGDSDPRP